jgi:hypothetical protein
MSYIRNRTFEGYDTSWRAERSYAHDPPPRSFRRRTPSRQAAPKLPLAATKTTITTLPIHPPHASPVASPQTIIESPHTMAEKELSTVLSQLHQSLKSHNYQQSTSLLSKAKIALLNINALIPQEKSSRKHLQLARETPSSLSALKTPSLSHATSSSCSPSTRCRRQRSPRTAAMQARSRVSICCSS